MSSTTIFDGRNGEPASTGRRVEGRRILNGVEAPLSLTPVAGETNAELDEGGKPVALCAPPGNHTIHTPKTHNAITAMPTRIDRTKTMDCLLL
jgi:hypothetical protein